MNNTPTFDYKEIDQDGLDTLDVIADADAFNRWMYDTIRPFAGETILEIGSGIGNISKFFLADEKIRRMDLSDIRANYRDFLERNLANSHSGSAVLDLDIVATDLSERYANRFGTYDTVFSCNVIEHIRDDRMALTNAARFLKPGGRLIILVPAYQWLYNRFDRTLDHYRRYTTRSLADAFPTNLTVIHRQYFNTIGMIGWFVSGRLLGKKTIPGGQMRLFNQLVPFFKLVDKVHFNSFGLSAIVVGEKRQL